MAETAKIPTVCFGPTAVRFVVKLSDLMPNAILGEVPASGVAEFFLHPEKRIIPGSTNKVRIVLSNDWELFMISIFNLYIY